MLPARVKLPDGSTSRDAVQAAQALEFTNLKERLMRLAALKGSRRNGAPPRTWRLWASDTDCGSWARNSLLINRSNQQKKRARVGRNTVHRGLCKSPDTGAGFGAGDHDPQRVTIRCILPAQKCDVCCDSLLCVGSGILTSSSTLSMARGREAP
jgi:hypothetical protein